MDSTLAKNQFLLRGWKQEMLTKKVVTGTLNPSSVLG